MAGQPGAEASSLSLLSSHPEAMTTDLRLDMVWNGSRSSRRHVLTLDEQREGRKRRGLATAVGSAPFEKLSSLQLTPPQQEPCCMMTSGLTRRRKNFSLFFFFFLTVQIFCFYIMASNFVFPGFFLCGTLYLYMFHVLFLTPFPLVYFILFQFVFILSYY